MAQLIKCEVLVLDDLLISPMTQDEQRDLLEIVEERYDRKSTIITSQLPVKAWHEAMQDKTLADAIMDRVVHNAYKIDNRIDADEHSAFWALLLLKAKKRQKRINVSLADAAEQFRFTKDFCDHTIFWPEFVF